SRRQKKRPSKRNGRPCSERKMGIETALFPKEVISLTRKRTSHRNDDPCSSPIHICRLLKTMSNTCLNGEIVFEMCSLEVFNFWNLDFYPFWAISLSVSS
ncbi:hypothetical protein CDAR_187281, partial [Caerostris darwini]